MAFVANNNQQINLKDSTFNLTEREKKFLKNPGQKRLLKRFFLPSVRMIFLFFIVIKLPDQIHR